MACFVATVALYVQAKWEKFKGEKSSVVEPVFIFNEVQTFQE